MNPDQDSRTAGGEVPARVAAALAVCNEQYRQAIALPHQTAEESAVRAQRVALAVARTAGWWGVLQARSTGTGVPWVYRLAVINARVHERERARFWRGLARDWRVRVERGEGTAGAWAMWDDRVAGVA
jgi:hypothetical protein